jgi:hypothetical protein
VSREKSVSVLRPSTQPAQGWPPGRAHHHHGLAWRSRSGDPGAASRPERAFLTHDEGFVFDKKAAAIVVWRQAIQQLLSSPRPQQRFELLDDGRLLPWEEVS